MKIGEVAEELGIPASTIRYYEKVGLIDHQQRISGQRRFDTRARSVLRFVQLAQAAGFTIGEIKSLLESYAQDPTGTGVWKPFAEAKQTEVRQQINTLQQMDRVLTELIGCRCGSIEVCVRQATSDNRSADQRLCDDGR